MSLKPRKKVILAKIESTYGTDAVPTGSANAILTHGLAITPLVADTIGRDLDKPELGNEVAIHVGAHVAIEFDVELAGAGAAGTAPAYGPLLRACGMAETVNAGVSVEYDPISTGEPSLSIYFHMDGQKHALLGARGTWSMRIASSGIPYLHFAFVGLWSDPAAASDPTPDFSDFVTPIPVSNVNTPTFSLHAYSGILYSLEFDQANTVIHRDLVNDESVQITDRAPAGRIVLEAPALGTKNFFTIAKANTTGALQLVHGTTAGNICQFDAPAAQLLQPTYGDADGRATISAGLVFVPSSGDDDFKLTVK